MNNGPTLPSPANCSGLQQVQTVVTIVPRLSGTGATVKEYTQKSSIFTRPLSMSLKEGGGGGGSCANAFSFDPSNQQTLMIF